MAVKILQGMNPIDAAIASAGSAEDLWAFCALNGIGITDDLMPGEVLQGTGLTYMAASSITNPQIVTAPVNILPGQTPIDLAMQTLGSSEGFFAFCILNGLNFTDDLTPGEQLNYSLTPYSSPVLKIYKDNNYKPASGLSIPGPSKPVLLSGISYWALEYDFVVQ